MDKQVKGINVLNVLLVFYVLYYFIMSRYSVHVMFPLGFEGFYYIPCYPDTEELRFIDTVLRYIFYPIWLFDHHVLGGPGLANIGMDHM